MIQHFSGVHHSNADLLGIDRSVNDPYLQTMNDNLHKKFRRPNPPYSSLHPTDGDYTPMNSNNNQIYHLGPLNGDYKNNIHKPTVGNGQAQSTNNADEDDDDIVLVSDDDSAEKQIETKINSNEF